MSLRPFRSLRARLMWGIGIPLLTLQLVVAGVEYRLGVAAELAEMHRELDTLTRLVAVRIDQALSLVAVEARTKARVWAAGADLHRTAPLLPLDGYFGGLAGGSSLAFCVKSVCTDEALRALVAREGTSPAPADAEQVAALRGAWLDRARGVADGFWTEPYAMPGQSGAGRVSYVVPITDRQRFQGALGADIPLERLKTLIHDADFASGGFMIANRAGAPLATDDAEPLPAERIAAWIEPLITAGQGAPGGGTAATRRSLASHDDREIWVFLAPIPSAGWALIATVDQASALASVRSRLLWQAVVYGSGTLAILGLLAWLSARTTRPLIPLAEAARRAAHGDLDARVPGPLGRDEIGRFAMVFNRMMGDLKASVAARLEATAARQAVESELAVALKIQRTLLPGPLVSAPGVEVATRFVPARFVAGDFYDHFWLSPDTLAVAIADVSGKGVAAALFMAAARTSLRNFTRSGASPAESLAAINRALFEDNRELVFVTAFAGHYHLPSGTLVYANAGHNVPYVIRHGGTPEALGESTGPLLAVFPDASFENRTVTLAAGDTLVLYTDGVVEASDHRDELYGEERLETLLRRQCDDGVEALCDRIIEAVQQHCEGAPQDDVTLLVLRRPRPAAGSAR